MQIPANTEAPAKSPAPWRNARRLLLVLCFFGLASLNVLTLVSDKVHSAGYDAMKAMLVMAVPEAAASRLLSNSPTAKRQHDVAIKAAAVLKTSKRIAVRSLVNTTRNVSSVFAEAIPIVGTGAMLAVTAWDVHDACETLKDLNELNSVFDHPPEDKTKVCGMHVPSAKQVLEQTRTNAKAVYQSAADALKKEDVAPSP